MKVTLDLTRLRAEGRITAEEHDRLLALSTKEGASLAINILIGFGVAAVSLAALALVPDPRAALALGGLMLAGGTGLLARLPAWRVLGAILVLVGALLFCGGLVVLQEGSAASFLTVTAVFAVAALLSGSGLLAVLAVFGLSGALDARAGYSHAVYSIAIPEPAATVLVFSTLAFGLYRLSKHLPPAAERLALIGARTALFLVNLGFWVGSLWGDETQFGMRESFGRSIPAEAFVIGWALGLLAVGAWAVRENRRWVLNLAAIFGGIHFYTQWFERLGATPLSLLAAGLVLLAIAFGLWRWNERFSREN